MKKYRKLRKTKKSIKAKRIKRGGGLMDVASNMTKVAKKTKEALNESGVSNDIKGITKKATKIASDVKIPDDMKEKVTNTVKTIAKENLPEDAKELASKAANAIGKADLPTANTVKKLSGEVANTISKVELPGNAKEMASKVSNALNLSNPEAMSKMTDMLPGDLAGNLNPLGDVAGQLGINSAEDVKEIQEKINKKQEILMTKTPFNHLTDIFMNTLYNMASLYIYIPSVMLNLPNTTLEKAFPDKDTCKLLFNDQLTCQKKIKCFFKKCSAMEDVKGFKLEQERLKTQQRMIGGRDSGNKSTNNDNEINLKDKLKKGKCVHEKTLCAHHTESDYKKKMPLTLMEKKNVKIIDFIHSQNQKYARAFKYLFAIKGGQGCKCKSKKIMHGGKRPKTIDEESNMKEVIMNHLDVETIYKFLFLYKMMEQIYDDIDDEVREIQSRLPKEKYLVQKDAFGNPVIDNAYEYDPDNYIPNNNTQNTNASNNEQNNNNEEPLFNEEPEYLHVPFPFQRALLDLPTEHIECLQAQLFGTTEAAMKANPTLKTCVPCEKCTMGPISAKVVSRVMKDLVGFGQRNMASSINIMFDQFTGYFKFEQYDTEQLILLHVMNAKLLIKDLNILNLKLSVDSDDYKYSDVLCGIPKMFKDDTKIFSKDDIILSCRPMFAFYKAMSMDKILTYCLMKKTYMSEDLYKSNKLKTHKIKHIIKFLIEIYHKYARNNVAYKKTHNILLKRLKLKVLNKHFEPFDLESIRRQDKSKALFEDMIKSKKMNINDKIIFEQHLYEYRDILNKNYENTQSEFIRELHNELKV